MKCHILESEAIFQFSSSSHPLFREGLGIIRSFLDLIEIHFLESILSIAARRALGILSPSL